MSNVDDFDDDEDFGIPDEGQGDGEYCGDGWCIECLEPFHLDDTGGYNPPCSCGFHCRSCHEHEEAGFDDDDYPEDDYQEDEVEWAAERFWDGRVGHSDTTDELPF